jgi:hypothetical protein
MHDRFFSQTACDRCGGSLSEGRILSMFNTDCICMNCKTKERAHNDYSQAVEREREALQRGNRNYKGIWNE